MKAKLPKSQYKRVYLALTSLVGFALLLFLLKSMLVSKPVADQRVKFSFSPASTDSRGKTNFKLLLNHGESDVTFVRAYIYFDPSELQLASDAIVQNPSLTKVLFVTSMTEANNLGAVEVVIAKEPSTNHSHSGQLQIAELSFSKIKEGVSQVTLVDEESQVVDSRSKELPFIAEHATVAASN